MLRRFTRPEIEREWERLKAAIEQALPPISGGHEKRMEQVYNNLLLGTLQCWGIYEGEEKEAKIEGVPEAKREVESETWTIDRIMNRSGIPEDLKVHCCELLIEKGSKAMLKFLSDCGLKNV